MAAAVAVLLMLAVAGLGPLAGKLRAPGAVLALRLALGGAGVILAAVALWGRLEGADALQAALWMVGAMVGASAPWSSGRDGRAELVWLGWALGPLLAALVLAAQGLAWMPGRVLDDNHVRLVLASGALLAMAAGFTVRGLGRLARVSPMRGLLGGAAPLWAAAAMGALAWRRLVASGLDPFVAQLPVMGADGQVPVWLTQTAQGLPLVHLGSQGQAVSVLLLAGAALALVASFLRKERASAGAAILGGAALLAAAGAMMAAHGQAVEPATEKIRFLLELVGAPEPLVQKPQLYGQAPFAVSLRLMGAPLALALTAGLGALGLGVARWLGVAAEGEDGWDEAIHWLAARDAAQLGVLCLWLATAAWLLAQRHVSGVWGPVRPSEHLMSGSALLATGSLLALHALGSQGRPWARVGRAVAFVVLAVAVASAALGGLVTGLGVFELP